MSGGHFADNGYIYYQVEQFADELRHELTNEDQGCLKPTTVATLRIYVQRILELARMMRHIDYFYSGDTSEECLIRNMGTNYDPNVALVNSASALSRLASTLRNSNKESITSDELELMASKIYRHAYLNIQKGY